MFYLRRSIQTAAASLILTLVGCQTVPYQGQAREVKRKPQTEGVISLALSHRPEDRDVAQQKMASNCGAFPIEVLEEGEVAVGQATEVKGKEKDRASTEQKVGQLFGIPLITGEAGGKDTETSSVTTAVKEWHISYKCNKRASAKKR